MEELSRELKELEELKNLVNKIENIKKMIVWAGFFFLLPIIEH